jgi:ketosteroid isomerase-like protein
MIEYIKMVYAALIERDVPAMEKLLGPGFVLIEAAPLPYAGRWEGAQGVKDLITAFNERYYSAWSAEFHDFTASSQRVVAHLTLTATGKRSGKSAALRIMEVWTFKDGKPVEMMPYYWNINLAAEVAG